MDQEAIFITGAASGIGRATAERFHAEGWFVGGYDLDADGLDALARLLGDDGTTGVLDVTDKAAFDAAVASRLSKRLRLIFTPKNGSWLNVAEMELSILSRQCFGKRRLATAENLDAAILAWQTERNNRKAGTNWRFSSTDARIKLKSLYPMPDIYR